MDYVVHVGDRQDLPRISGDATRPVENSLVEVGAKEFFFAADDIGKTNYAFAHHNPGSAAGKEPGRPSPFRPGAPGCQLRNMMARCLVRLIRLAVDKHDLHFLRPVTKHYDHHLSVRSSDVPNVTARPETALQRR
jgi:hypothetical protein